MNLKELKEKKITDLSAIAKELGVEGAAGMRKQDHSQYDFRQKRGNFW
jgi:transcription termination factor Rho